MTTIVATMMLEHSPSLLHLPFDRRKKPTLSIAIPYNATLTKFDLKSNATGGLTAAVFIAGGDFGNPTTGFVTGATLETTGLTGINHNLWNDKCERR